MAFSVYLDIRLSTKTCFRLKEKQHNNIANKSFIPPVHKPQFQKTLKEDENSNLKILNIGSL